MQDCGVQGSIWVDGVTWNAEEEEVYAVCQADDGKDYRVVVLNGTKHWQEVPVAEDDEGGEGVMTIVELLAKPIHKLVSIEATKADSSKKNRGRPKKEPPILVTPVMSDMPKKVVVKKTLVSTPTLPPLKKVIMKKVASQ